MEKRINLKSTKRLRNAEAARELYRGLGLSEANNPIPSLPLTAGLEERDALKALEYVTFSTGCAGGAQASML
jgi:hypothetical protein